jgi:hypothetical protein
MEICNYRNPNQGGKRHESGMDVYLQRIPCTRKHLLKKHEHPSHIYNVYNDATMPINNDISLHEGGAIHQNNPT